MPCSLGNSSSVAEKYRDAGGRIRRRRDSFDLFRIVTLSSYVSPISYALNSKISGSTTNTSEYLTGAAYVVIAAFVVVRAVGSRRAGFAGSAPPRGCRGFGANSRVRAMRRSAAASSSLCAGFIVLARAAILASFWRFFAAHSSSLKYARRAYGGTSSATRFAFCDNRTVSFSVGAAYPGSSVSSRYGFVSGGATLAATRSAFRRMSSTGSSRSSSRTIAGSRSSSRGGRGAPVWRWRTVYMRSATSRARASAAAASASAVSRCASTPSRASILRAAWRVGIGAVGGGMSEGKGWGEGTVRGARGARSRRGDPF